MKIRVKLSESIEAELEAPSPKVAFQQIASLCDVLSFEVCGKCQSPNTDFEYRKTDENYEYFSKHCRDCQAQLDLGQFKDDKRLFVKRSEHKDSRGWYHWQREEQNNEYSQEAPESEASF